MESVASGLAGESPDTLRLAFSCVVDRNEAIERAALIWTHSLIAMEGVDPAAIFVHSVEPDLDVLEHLRTLGVQVVNVERFGDGKHCNKLAQLLSTANPDADILVMNDCDIAFTGDFSNTFQSFARKALEENERTVLGKTVDFCNPPLEVFSRLMAVLDLGAPDAISYDTLTKSPMPRGYFNGGLYGIPVRLLREFGEAWQEWALRLLASSKALDVLGSYAWHIDQISFYLAQRELGIEPYHLDERFNYPTHTRHSTTQALSSAKPLAIHFHNNLGQDGLLGPSGIRVVDLASSEINKCLTKRGLRIEQGYESSKPFVSWQALEKDFSMTTNNAATLRTFLKAAGIERAKSVLDVRCATGRHLEGLQLHEYRGLDARAAEVDLASRRDFNGVVLHGVPTTDDRAEMVLCLDFLGFSESIGGPPIAAELLATITEKRLVVLGEPQAGFSWLAEGSAGMDVGGELERTGRFAEIIELGIFAGRPAFLAFHEYDNGQNAQSRPFSSGPERLYARLGGQLDANMPERVAMHAGELAILKRLPEHLDGSRIAILAGSAPHDMFETALDLRVATHDRLAAPPIVAANDQDDESTAIESPSFSGEPYDFIAVLPDFNISCISERLFQGLAEGLRARGTMLVALKTQKRAKAVAIPRSSAVLSDEDIFEMMGRSKLLATSVHEVPLPFDYPFDVMVVEAAKTENQIDTEPAKRRHTPQFLRRFEGSLRRRIRGQRSKK